MKRKWWKEAIVYQIYPMSFCDSNGDGIGDIRGIINKLDYLEDLGVNVIWICPTYESPFDDNGYDISNYYKIAGRFGTNTDMEELIARARERGIYILLDLVINHCSDEHPWFQKALEDSVSPEAGYFYFRPLKDGKVPNNWRSNFGGSVWEPVGDGRCYYHTFGKKQPDLNWDNKELREKLYQMINWWIAKGIGGFRLDAITFIKKDISFENRYPVDKFGLYPVESMTNYPGIECWLSEMYSKTFAHSNCMTVAEAAGVPLNRLSEYTNDDGYFSMIFEFSFADMNQKLKDWSVAELKKRIFKSQLASQNDGWLGIFLENHDGPRSVNKYVPACDIDRFQYQAKTLLATLYFLLRGTPFIYQGQELGMENYPFSSLDEFRDIRDIQVYREAVSTGISEQEARETLVNFARDNSRTPMQWDATPNAGFTEGCPWIALNPNHMEYNVEAESVNPHSVLHYYKELIRLRHDPKLRNILVYGDFVPLETDDLILAYLRRLEGKEIAVICNFSAEHQNVCLPFKPRKILLSNYADVSVNSRTMLFEPYQAVVFY